VLDHPEPVPRQAPSYFDTVTANPTTSFIESPSAAMLEDAVTTAKARATIRYPTSLANVGGGLPLVVPPASLPVVGRPFTVGWTTRPSAGFPNSRTALLATLQPPPAPSLIPNGGGGMLMVPPDYVIIPGSVPWLTQDAGRVRFDITLLPQLAGLRMWMQLLVADARVPAGVTVSPMLELVFGS
jgi:hypothetical protein